MSDWFYYDNAEKKCGPISVAELKSLAANGTVTQDTLIENHIGKQSKASNVKGLSFLSVPPIVAPPDVYGFSGESFPDFSEPVPVSVPVTAERSYSTRKENKVIIVENTVFGLNTFFALLFPFQDNYFSKELEKLFTQTLIEQNKQGWSVSSVTYGFSPHAKLSQFQLLLLVICAFLLTICTLGIYLIVYILAAFFKRGRIDHYVVILERIVV